MTAVPGSDVRRVRTRVAVLVALALLAGFAVYLYFEETELLDTLTREDGTIEYLQAGLYLLASVGFVIGLARLRFRNIWYIGYALLFFVIAGEEISWGQRLFGIETPEQLARINEQNELTLHNIQGLQGSARAIGLMVTFGICIVIPAAYRWIPPVRRLILKWRHPVFPMWASPVLVIGFLFMAVSRVMLGYNEDMFDEMGELYVAIAMFIFGITAIRGRNPEPLSTEGGSLGEEGRPTGTGGSGRHLAGRS